MDSGVAGMTSVEIIVFKPQHLDDVRALWEFTEGIGVRDNETDERILVFLERNPGMSFVAISGSKLIGSVLCGHDGRRGYFHHLAVNPDYRRYGIAELMFDSSMAALAADDIVRINVVAFSDNELARGFWTGVDCVERNDLSVYSRDV